MVAKEGGIGLVSTLSPLWSDLARVVATARDRDNKKKTAGASTSPAVSRESIAKEARISGTSQT
jgi:hypothetical protein